MNYVIQNQYVTLTVKSKGAEKTSLKYNGVEYIRQRDAIWDRQAPFLFPNVGRLRDNYTHINGVRYDLPQHGFLRDQEFELLRQAKDELSLVSLYNENTLKQFPFKYKVVVTYTLKKKSVRTTIQIVNENHQDMLFNIGGHPGFICPLFEGETFEDYRVVFEKEESFTAPSVESNGTLNFTVPSRSFTGLKELPLDYNYFDIDAIVIPRVKSKKVQLVNRENKGLEFSYPGFLTLALWTRPQAGFLCLEPWIGHADRHDSDHQFDEKDNIIILKEFEEFKVHYDITILD